MNTMYARKTKRSRKKCKGYCKKREAKEHNLRAWQTHEFTEQMRPEVGLQHRIGTVGRNLALNSPLFGVVGVFNVKFKGSLSTAGCKDLIVFKNHRRRQKYMLSVHQLSCDDFTIDIINESTLATLRDHDDL
ncbi:hypothetical protein KQX54_012368 [Cotesia glomerata]|uniref:Uncharacterized protein n=1 Tax=Cotesia glomerata TaxID=32391 RepID=A0AAV7I231_COTGL|nr:hypothetical protein KQX54_012368 [Cotesia glomerata]